MCELVAKLRRHCEAARRNGWSNGASPLTRDDFWTRKDGQEEPGQFEHADPSVAQVNRLVGDLTLLATIVDTVDIASGSTKWKMLQNLVADAETEMLDEE